MQDLNPPLQARAKGPFRGISSFGFRWLVLLWIPVYLMATSCARPMAPEIKGVSKFKINRKNPEKKIQFQVQLDMFNPNRFKVKLLDYDLEIYVNGKKVGEVKGDEKVVMKKLERMTYPLKIRTSLGQVVGGLVGLSQELKDKDLKIDVRVEGVVKAKAHGIAKRKWVKYSREIPLKL